MPTYDGLACTSCAANEWDNEGTCTLCSDGGVDHCGRCGIDGACLACYNNLIVTDDGSGVVTECTCAGTQFLSVPDEDVEGTQCVPCNNVLQGGIEDCILCELDTDTNLPVCTECIDPLFVSVTDGTCTSEACGEIVDGECVTCNTRDNLVFYTQQNTCVLNCEDPYTLVEVDGASTCTVDCPSGQYSLGTTCNECVASDCHRCIESGECIHCNFGTSCEIDCSSNTMLTIYDYETDNQEVSRCVSECSAQNSVVSYLQNSGFSIPRCRYCTDPTCTDCREDPISGDLLCWKCPEGKLTYLDECVDTCPAGSIQDRNRCIKLYDDE